MIIRSPYPDIAIPEACLPEFLLAELGTDDANRPAVRHLHLPSWLHLLSVDRRNGTGRGSCARAVRSVDERGR